MNNTEVQWRKLDKIPNFFLENIFNSVSEEVVKMFNNLLQWRVSPTVLKPELIKPLLGKSDFDSLIPATTIFHFRWC